MVMVLPLFEWGRMTGANWQQREKGVPMSAIRKAIGMFVVVTGIGGAVVQILSVTEPLRTASLAAMFVTIAGLGGWVIWTGFSTRRRTDQALPEIDILVDICAAYTVSPATLEEVEWIADLESEVYSEDDAVHRSVLKEWFEANPNGFSIIRMANQTKVGHIDLLPIRPATFQRFLEGSIVEKDIRGDSLYSATEAAAITSLYVESIIVNPPRGYTTAPAILCVLTSFDGLVARICEPSRLKNFYAIAASRSGQRLLRRLGFDVIKSANTRKDGHDLFVADYAELRRHIAALGSPRFPQS